MGPRFLDLEGVLVLTFKIERGHSQLFHFFFSFWSSRFTPVQHSMHGGVGVREKEVLPKFYTGRLFAIVFLNTCPLVYHFLTEEVHVNLSYFQL